MLVGYDGASEERWHPTRFARERTLQDEIAPAVEQRVPGVEVLALELLSPSRFRVFIDHPAGVDLALCERVTRLLDPYPADYTIDVSSPGPERRLRKPEHFAGALGQRVSLRTSGKESPAPPRSDGEAPTRSPITLDTGDAGEFPSGTRRSCGAT